VKRWNGNYVVVNQVISLDPAVSVSERIAIVILVS
jgi:hypothetical protein